MSEQQGGAVDAPGYEIVRRIGGTEGADVHLARQQALGREVALKVLRSAAQDTEQLERFAFETRTAAALLHPHIVPLLDSGTTRDGRPYYAMPWLAGGDLASRLPLPPVEVRRVGLALCDALWYAHGRNVVHRDIKPSNILFDDTGRPLLADFGIATSIIGSRGLTLPGRTLGAARYISPEQARGEKVDPRADLYSLAVVLFEALTGSPPFVAGDDVATAALHATAAVPRLPEPHARWQPFFDRALAKAPADRFMSARTMAQALELIDTGDAAAIPAPVAVAAVPLAAAAAAATPGDDLPHMRMEPPSYLEGAPRPQPARRANRFAGVAVLLGVIALAAIVGYALTRDEDERFEPLAVTPGSSAPMPVPSPAAAPPPDAVEPGKVTAAAATPAAASTPKPATRAPAPAASSGPDEDDGLPGEDLDGEPAPSDPDEAAVVAAEDDPYAVPDELPGGDDAYDPDVADVVDPGEAIDADPIEPDDDPAPALGGWSPPIGELRLDGSPEDQLAAIDAQLDEGRAWLEDERWRVEELQDSLSPREAERALEAFEAQEQQFERWLDRMDALRERVARDAY